MFRLYLWTLLCKWRWQSGQQSALFDEVSACLFAYNSVYSYDPLTNKIRRLWAAWKPVENNEEETKQTPKAVGHLRSHTVHTCHEDSGTVTGPKKCWSGAWPILQRQPPLPPPSPPPSPFLCESVDTVGGDKVAQRLSKTFTLQTRSQENTVCH